MFRLGVGTSWVRQTNWGLGMSIRGVHSQPVPVSSLVYTAVSHVDLWKRSFPHFMGQEARGSWRWRGSTRHANQTATDCGTTSSLKQAEFCCTTVIYWGACAAACQPGLFCCMENLNKPDLQIVKPFCTLSISDRNCSSSTIKLIQSLSKKSKITSWPLWELLVQPR